MKVKKRDGSLEEMRYDKITKRISILCHDLNMEYIDPTYVTLKVTQGIYDGINVRWFFRHIYTLKPSLDKGMDRSTPFCRGC